MDDHLQTRLDALEQQMRTVNRRLHWWRGLAGGLVVLAVLTWALPSETAQEELTGGHGSLVQRLAALEQKLKHMTLVTTADEFPEFRITGANLRIVNGLGETTSTNGLGNLIVGYNESRALDFDEEDIRTGSHNVVVGKQHNFSRFGGMVAGRFNTISGDFSSVSGGEFNTASGDFSSVSAGFGNTASAFSASVSGGVQNTASGPASSVSGGQLNTANGDTAAVSGGNSNTANGPLASVSGGNNRTAPGEFDWAAGALFSDN
jgi:hypothetical protein